MELKFLQQLEEGRALSRTGQLDNYRAEDVLRLLFLELGAALMFQHEPAAKKYAETTLHGGPFTSWRMFGTDLYNAATALNSSEFRNKMGVYRGTLNIPLLQKLLRDISNGRGKHMDYSEFTMGAQRSFGISDSSLMSIRRRITDYDLLGSSQREQLFNDMKRYYAPFGNQGDMMNISKTKSSGSFLGWAAKTGLATWGGYEIGKRIAKALVNLK